MGNEPCNNLVLSVVVPVFNEEEVIGESYKRLNGVLESIGEPYELIFVNDGSRDKTLEKLKEISETDKNVRVLSFSRNFGHQPAITAGMEYAKGDAIAVIDADLQDPPELIPAMLEKWREGYDVVYGKRTKRKGETFFKKATASVYYRLLRSMTSFEIPVDAGDFRLIDRKVCDALVSLGEKNRYVRGLVSWVGFKQTGIEYVRDERFAGETKYPLKKMIKLSVDGITAFSYKPLKIATWLGGIMSFFSLIFLLIVLLRFLIAGVAASGWAIAVGTLLFSQGLVLLAIGMVGEYIGRIFEEAKGRPVYIVRETLGYERGED